jgi:peptidylprolyl isomerase
MRLLVALAFVSAFFVTACTGAKDAQSGGTITPKYLTAAATAPAGTPCAATPTKTGGKKTYAAPPPMTIDPSKKYTATIKMDVGDIMIELYPKDAPIAVNNFVFLARDHYYDGVTFHRVIAGFMAQGGDPTGTGKGGPGYTIKDEFNSRKFLEGTVGMAKTSAPNSGGSQFFIDFSPQPQLDGGYTVFGQLIAGRDVLNKIAIRDPQTAECPGTRINTIEIQEQ